MFCMCTSVRPNIVLIAVSKRELVALAHARYDIQLRTWCVSVSPMLIRVSLNLKLWSST